MDKHDWRLVAVMLFGYLFYPVGKYIMVWALDLFK